MKTRANQLADKAVRMQKLGYTGRAKFLWNAAIVNLLEESRKRAKGSAATQPKAYNH